MRTQPTHKKILMTITGSALHATAKARQFCIHKIGERKLVVPKTEWFPFSQIEKSYVAAGQIGEDYMIVSEWILQQKGLLDPDDLPTSAPSATSTSGEYIPPTIDSPPQESKPLTGDDPFFSNVFDSYDDEDDMK